MPFVDFVTGNHEEVDLEAFTDEMGPEWTALLFLSKALRRFLKFRSLFFQNVFYVFFLLNGGKLGSQNALP